MTTVLANQCSGVGVAALPVDPAVFAANISALARRNPRLAEALLKAPSDDGARVRFFPTEQALDGRPALSAELDGRALCSKRRPIDEAAKLAETLDARNAGCAAVLGFGLGYHVRALSERLHEIGVVACYEPDLGLLRAVFERIDHSGWLGRGTTAIFHECDNQGALTFGLQGWEAPLAIGVQIVEHAPSRARLGEGATRFGEVLSSVVGTVRTHVVTTMVQTDVTARNALMNLEHYAGRPGIEGFQGAALGRPALVVSAGPSLKRSMAVLKQAWVRERCVIVAVQTVLKQLLSEGIRPHFVCALDYHEISRRFYEGLSAADVEGVTLIAEPKANAAILDAFPGEKRLAADDFLEEVLGSAPELGLAGAHAPIRPGATVAHLAYAFGRHLGCDPVILVGQDLAFTDGQYYSAGAAIHRVWSGELNAFNTLEMMEWQRIVRMRGNLHEMTDHLGRKVYSDDQMVAYLHQFERDFMQDESRGLTTIDATEGGVSKAYTVPMPLADALEMHVRHARALPASFEAADRSAVGEGRGAGDRRAALTAELRRIRTDARTIARLSRETRDLLGKLAGRLDDPDRANALIRQIHALRDRVESLRPAYGLVHRINQAGTFKRFKADRAIRIEIAKNPKDEQRLRVERDSMNVGWMADAAEALADLLAGAADALEGKPKRTRDPGAKPGEASAGAPGSSGAGVAVGAEPAARVGAFIIADAALGLGHLRETLERIAGSASVRSVTIITDREEAARGAVGGPVIGLDVGFVRRDLAGWRERRRSVMAARAWAGTCWRGGIGGLTVFDEAFDPRLFAEAMSERACGGGAVGAALVVGADWRWVDGGLLRGVVERYVERAGSFPLTFTQAPPGLCGCVISRDLVDELARGAGEGAVVASIGGVLGYRPLNARSDPIALACCVGVEAAVRDTLWRFIPDGRDGWTGAEGEQAFEAVRAGRGGAAELCGAAAGVMASGESRASEVEVWVAGAGGFAPMDALERRLRAWAPRGGGPALTLRGGNRAIGGACGAAPDVLEHPEFARLIVLARGLGFRAVHVRTSLDVASEAFERALPLLGENADVVSVDFHAGTAETYLALTGRDRHAVVMERADRLLQLRRDMGGLPLPWIVPRITRRDAVYEEIEGFFDKSILVAGWGVIDPLPEALPGERIEPLPVPENVERRWSVSRVVIGADGEER